MKYGYTVNQIWTLLDTIKPDWTDPIKKWFKDKNRTEEMRNAFRELLANPLGGRASLNNQHKNKQNKYPANSAD